MPYRIAHHRAASKIWQGLVILYAACPDAFVGPAERDADDAALLAISRMVGAQSVGHPCLAT